jgi:integrase
MAWVEKLPNGTYRACWRDEIGRKRSRAGFQREPQAARYGGEQESKARRGEPTSDGRAPTWGDWCPIWTAARRVEPSTVDSDTGRIARHITPRWGARRINRITRTDVQAWVNDLADQMAPASVEKVYRLFSASLTAAVRDERVPLAVNPCTGVKLPTVAPGHERFLTRAEVDRIAYFLGEPYRTAVLLAAGTGLRWGELEGLHWQRVDLEAGLIDVVETWDSAAERIKTYPKGRKRRAVPIPGWLSVALHAAWDGESEHRATCGQDHAPGGARCRSGLVVPGPRGAPLDGRNFGRRQWPDACRLARIDPPTLRDLRHTYASWLVQAGVDLYEVQRLLGHASIVTTQRYAHLGTSQNDKVLAALA